jgi:hypothetical protein
VHISARARSEAAAESDWVGATDRVWAAADLVVTNVPADTPMHLFVGEMPLDQYLASRVVELVVHGSDLAVAIALPSPPPRAAARVAIEVLLDLAPSEDVGAVARLLTGRSAPLPLANVLA